MIIHRSETAIAARKVHQSAIAITLVGHMRYVYVPPSFARMPCHVDYGLNSLVKLTLNHGFAVGDISCQSALILILICLNTGPVCTVCAVENVWLKYTRTHDLRVANYV